jgi:hypothetical protein
MQIDLSAEHCSNADLPSVETLQPDSNVKLESLVQAPKHHSEIVSTDAGIQIARRAEHPQNADSPRNETLQPGSNVKEERLLHS